MGEMDAINSGGVVDMPDENNRRIVECKLKGGSQGCFHDEGAKCDCECHSKCKHKTIIRKWIIADDILLYECECGKRFEVRAYDK